MDGASELITWIQDGWRYLVLLIGAVGIIWGAVKIFKEAYEPFRKKKEQQTEKDNTVNDRLDRLEEHDKIDMGRFDSIDKELFSIKQDVNERFDRQEKTNQATMSALTAIINHMIDGNGIDGLKESRDELLRYIINK